MNALFLGLQQEIVVQLGLKQDALTSPQRDYHRGIAEGLRYAQNLIKETTDGQEKTCEEEDDTEEENHVRQGSQEEIQGNETRKTSQSQIETSY